MNKSISPSEDLQIKYEIAVNNAKEEIRNQIDPIIRKYNMLETETFCCILSDIICDLQEEESKRFPDID